MALSDSQKRQAERNRRYWEQRENEALKQRIKDEKEYDKQLKRIYQTMLDNCQKEIDAFYGKYAAQENITIAEAKKRVSKLDIAAYERKAKKYVAEKNFSKKANEEMRLYNATMKINRLEMLKANLGAELIAGHDELEKFMGGILKGRTEDELARQAGILGKTVRNNAQKADAIVNASFKNATFSDRIWMYQDLLKSDLSKLLESGLIQGKNPRVLAKELKKTFNTSTYNAERLMRTELARVQTEAQKQSFERNGFKLYEFIANTGCCDICQSLDGKHFRVDKMMPGKNAAPMHPHCVLPGTKIIAPDMDAMIKSEYLGDVVEIGTANGARLTVTANHIMLTSRGWVRAKNIIKGDKVVHYSGGAESVVEANPADYDGIPAVEQLFAAFVKASTVPPLSVPVAAEHLKGDVAPNSEINVVFVDSKLRDKLDPTAKQFVCDVPLVGASVRNKRELLTKCSLAELLVGFGLASDGIMSSTDVASILFRGTVGHHELIGFRRPSDYYTRLQKTAVNNRAADTESLCNGVLTNPRVVHFDDTISINVESVPSKGDSATGETTLDSTSSNAVEISDLVAAFPGVVSFDDVVFVANKFYSGHVYDASSLSTLYIANGLISSNCRCSVAAWENSDEYNAWLDYLSKGGTTEEWEKQKNQRKAVAKSTNDGKMKAKNDRLYTRDDPMVEVMGPARTNNPDELQEILDYFAKLGVVVKYRKGQYGYEIVGKGVPGEVIIDKDASLSAWLHEKQHVADDFEAGWSSKRILKNPGKRYRREANAYQVEIDLAKKLGRDDMVKRLTSNMERERRKIYGE